MKGTRKTFAPPPPKEPLNVSLKSFITDELHPDYGPCDGFGPGGECSECGKEQFASEADWETWLRSATPESRRLLLFDKIKAELDHAYAKHGRNQWNRHEFYAILLEEVDELWDAIKADEPQERVYEELKQVAAMCFRYYETQDRYREPNA